MIVNYAQLVTVIHYLTVYYGQLVPIKIHIINNRFTTNESILRIIIPQEMGLLKDILLLKI